MLVFNRYKDTFDDLIDSSNTIESLDRSRPIDKRPYSILRSKDIPMKAGSKVEKGFFEQRSLRRVTTASRYVAGNGSHNWRFPGTPTL